MSQSQTSGSSNPEYVNARLRTRRSKLFDNDDYRKLVRMGTGEIARYMEESAYESAINRLGARHSGVDLIEYSLNRNLATQFNDLLGWAEGKLYDQIAAYLRTFDAWNAKTALRGVYSGEPADGIQTDYITAGEFGPTLLDELAAAESVEEVVELLGETIFGEGLDQAYQQFTENETLVALENAIDRAFYEHLLDGIDTTVREAQQRCISRRSKPRSTSGTFGTRCGSRRPGPTSTRQLTISAAADCSARHSCASSPAI